MGIHLTGVYLAGVHLTGVHLKGVYLTGVHLMSVRLIGVVCTSRARKARNKFYKFEVTNMLDIQIASISVRSNAE
jgi:hypothetical protein